MIINRCMDNNRGGIFMRPVAGLIVAALPFLLFCGSTEAIAQTSEELEDLQSWAKRAFDRPVPDDLEAAKLLVVQKSHKMIKNRNVWGNPITLGDRRYDRGLYMDAPAKLMIHLGRPAATFQALAGIDRNQSTLSSRGCGSARFHVFHVSTGGRKPFSSEVVTVQDAPVEVAVPLDGAREFSISVDDGDDGRGWDQCVWADARVEFDDGTKLYLDEIPFAGTGPLRRLALPFSFVYDGKPSDAFLDAWEYAEETLPAGEMEGVERQRLILRDRESGLHVECVATIFADLPAVDWVLRLTNTGTKDTPIIEELLPLDAARLLGGLDDATPVTLRWSKGDTFGPDSFLPTDAPVEPDSACCFSPTGLGQSSKGVLPFFNLAGGRGGWVMAVGWTGQWMAEFTRARTGAVTVRAGMERAHFRLRPGESVRTPRIVLLRWNGPLMIRGHNFFRSLMLRHYTPKLDGQPACPPVAHNTCAALYVRKEGMDGLNEANQMTAIRKTAALGAEAYWMDAYWFPQPWPENLGNWYPRAKDFPRGLAPLSDAAHERDLQFVLWFRPLFVHTDSEWGQKYTSFLHDGSGKTRMWKLGDPEARRVLTDELTRRIQEWKVDIFREDDGGQRALPPTASEAPDRQGITEMHHVEGLYSFWKSLRSENPGLLIDNTNGGGNRIDLETCSLSFPLWRSDWNDIIEGLKGETHWPRMALADQVMVTGLSLYIPFHTGPVWDVTPYSFRSAMTSGAVLYGDLEREGFPDNLAREAIAELKGLRPCFLGDIYPLLDLTMDQRDWYAFQLDRPDLEAGCVLVFRRPDSFILACELELHNISPGSLYEVSTTGETYQEGPWRRMPGQELLHREVRIDEKPGSALIRYRRVK